VTSKIINGFGLAAAACAVALAGCASDPAPGRTTAAARYQPTAATDERLEAQASAFESFMHKARGIDDRFANGGEVAQALQTGASHEPHQLEAGMVAYAALAAMQEPGFVAAVQRAGRDPALGRRIAADPGLALSLPGGDAAAGRASAALYRQGGALADEGARVKKAAYTVQHQSWSKSKVPNAAGRLNRVKQLSAVSYRPNAADAARLQSAVAEGGRRAGSGPAVRQGVALAALTVLGQGDKGRGLMSDPRTGSCLRLAKLNLYQCLASSGPHYEDIFCLGQHAMIDPGQCVVEATRGPAPVRRMTVTKASYRR
jgi:hypothetical protein